MQHRERRNQDDNGTERRRRQAADVPAGTPETHDAAARLLAAGDEAINRALSNDSRAFLAANRQEGGQ